MGVLAHGVGLALTMWDAQVEALAPEFRVLRYDLLGHGGTPARPDTVSLLDFTNQLGRLLGHLELGSVNLVGFSMGGIIAQCFAADGTVVPRRIMTLSLTFDHAFVDGAPAADFLAGVRETLEAGG